MPKNAYNKKRKFSSAEIGREYKKQAIENWKTHTEQDLRDIACIQKATTARISEKEKAVDDTYAIKIQAVIRGWLVRMQNWPWSEECKKFHKKLLRATIKIQAFWRRKKLLIELNKETDEELRMDQREIVNELYSKVQSLHRGMVAPTSDDDQKEYEELFDMIGTDESPFKWRIDYSDGDYVYMYYDGNHPALTTFLKEVDATIKIQALARGYLERKRKKPRLSIEIPKWNIEEDTLDDGTIVRSSGPGHMGSPVMQFIPPEVPNNFRDQTIREFTTKRDCNLKGTFVPKGTLIRRVPSPVSGSPHYEVIPHPLKGIVPDPTEWHQEIVTNTLPFKTWVRPGKHASDHINIWDNGTITMSLTGNCFIG